MNRRTLILPIGGGGIDPSEKLAKNLSLTIDEDYVISANLVDQDGEVLGDVQTIDLPLESVVVDGRYDGENKNIVLTLDNGNEITIPVGGLVSGLVSTEQLQGLQAVVETKASQADLTSLQGVVDTKASQADLDALQGVVETKAEKVSYTSLERLGNYLYRITFEEVPDETDTDIPVAGGCTSFVKDGRLNRNLDWNYDNTNEFVVVCKDFNGMSFIPNLSDGNMDDTKLSQLPYHVNDGVNDSGIMVSSHVLYDDFGYTYTGTTKLTKLPYIVLTTLKSMDDIDDLYDVLSDISVNDYLAENHFLMQFMVTDGSTTYVITPSETGYELVDATELPKLTNFKWVNHATVSRSDADIQQHPTGIERWNMVETSSLRDLRYTVAYEEPTRLSEFIGINGTDKDSTDDELTAIYNTAHTKYITRTRDGELWQTMHSVVYTANGMESLFVQENYEKDYFYASELESLQAVVATKADSVDLAALQGVVDTKASQADLNALQGIVGTKASQADLASLQGVVGTLQGVVDTKANSSDLTTLQGVVDTKAAQADLLALQTTVAGKQDALQAGTGIDITNNVISNTAAKNIWKGTQSEFDAISSYDENTDYYIEGDSVQMSFELEDGSTVTYKFLVEK